MSAAQNTAPTSPIEPEQTARIVSRGASVVSRPAPTPMDLLSIAMDQGADLDRLERLMMMQERWEANEARKAYLSAFAAFKAAFWGAILFLACLAVGAATHLVFRAVALGWRLA